MSAQLTNFGDKMRVQLHLLKSLLGGLDFLKNSARND